MSQLAIITDEQGNFIDLRDRHNLKADDIVAITCIMLENSKGELLIAQRAYEKKNDPGLWGPSASGTLEQGETFDSNVTKELEEELGLTSIKPREVYRLYYKRPQDNSGRYAVWYWARCDKKAEDFVLQNEEVAQVKWVSKEDLLRFTSEKPEEFVGWPERWQKMIELTGYTD